MCFSLDENRYLDMTLKQEKAPPTFGIIDLMRIITKIEKNTPTMIAKKDLNNQLPNDNFY